jgi:divalent metal cation (Fe/Co/Zn/Cd) transporter
MKAKWFSSGGLLILALINIPFLNNLVTAGILGACLASSFWSWMYWSTSEMLDRSFEREMDLHAMIEEMTK